MPIAAPPLPVGVNEGRVDYANEARVFPPLGDLAAA